MSTSIVSPSATSVTLPVQKVHCGPPGKQGPALAADAGAARRAAEAVARTAAINSLSTRALIGSCAQVFTPGGAQRDIAPHGMARWAGPPQSSAAPELVRPHIALAVEQIGAVVDVLLVVRRVVERRLAQAPVVDPPRAVLAAADA